MIETNFRSVGAEIDIIAEKDETLCFVEVKGRLTDRYGLPAAFVDRRKQQRIIRAAKVFSTRKPYRDHAVRFDIIAVLDESGRPAIEHIENAFEEE